MDTRRLLCRELGAIRCIGVRVVSLLCLLLLGCGNSEAMPPRKLPTVNNTRYERVQVAIDGKPIDSNMTMTAGRDFVVTVSFRRHHVWLGMKNPESHIDVLVMQQIREHEVTCRNDSLNWDSVTKDGVLTFTGKVDGLKDSGLFGFWIQETVMTESHGMERYFLFATNLRNAKP
jgi:hypothetical protein